MLEKGTTDQGVGRGEGLHSPVVVPHFVLVPQNDDAAGSQTKEVFNVVFSLKLVQRYKLFLSNAYIIFYT